MGCEVDCWTSAGRQEPSHTGPTKLDAGAEVVATLLQWNRLGYTLQGVASTAQHLPT